MNKSTAWQSVVQLRDDLKSGELTLSLFAADLYDVVMGNARPVYQNPYEFFSFTYPTFNLRELTKDVVLRLAGKNDKAVRQLELTYGGGKTHTLITLYHLTHDPRHLPDLPAVKEFTQHIGLRPPHARVAVLAFDKLDAEKGMEIYSPDGEKRRLRQPWSVLAFQLAGSDGLRLLHAEGADAERESAPAEPLLVELLSIPVRQGYAPLILIDEVLMYVREKVGLDQRWRGTLINFFQYLTQAATKIDTCAIVASLLATDPNKSDQLGKELTQELSAVFRRENEEAVQPVVKEDVAEVLRRRFFTPESLRNPNHFRQYVAPIVQGIADLDEETQHNKQKLEERILNSYPFHPDLTEVLYSKWTQLESFQRTRGVLRTFALALREAATWDRSPLISTNVFLSAPDNSSISEAARELTNVAEAEEYEGKRQNWVAILEGELEKAQEIQQELPTLHHREIEQAVIATFLHSQPIGKKAQTGELFLLLGPGHPDKIELEKGLRRWTEVSWFLDESAYQDATTGQIMHKGLPGSWRLGSRPNLHQMHHDACASVATEVIEGQLDKEIRSCKSLTQGVSGTGAHVHMLPEHPRDIEDDADFHYAILKPSAASREGRPSSEAIRLLNEKTGPGSPRVYRNAVVLVAPSPEGLEAVRNTIRTYEGWVLIEQHLKGQEIDEYRRQLIESQKKEANKRIAILVKQAYNIVVTISAKNEIEAFRVVPREEQSLFAVIKADPRARIQETAVTAEALLPDGPYNLWHEGDHEHRVSDLEKSFAQFTHLPKMLKREAILDTLLDGCKQGAFVLRMVRGDRSSRTYWYEAPDAPTARTLDLYVVLSEVAELTTIPPRLLLPGMLPSLWSHNAPLPLHDLYRYFSGHTAMIQHEGYSEPCIIPRAERHVVNTAINEAVKAKHLWLIAGPASMLGQDIPPDLFMMDEATLQAPPSAIAASELLPDKLPEAWNGRSETTALALADALSTKHGLPLPWLTVRETITNAINARFIELAPDSATLSVDYMYANAIKISQRSTTPKTAPIPPTQPEARPRAETPASSQSSPRSSGTLVAEAALSIGEIQELADQVGDIKKRCTDYGLTATFTVRVEVTGSATSEQVTKLNELLKEISARLQLS